MDHTTFCRGDGYPYYDLPVTDSSDWPTELPTGWVTRDSGEWIFRQPVAFPMPEQGWKVHVSATLDNAEDILKAVESYCHRAGLAYKFIRSRTLLLRRNSKAGDRTASGKFVAIYPTDEAALERTLTELDAVIGGREGPRILTDLRFRSGPLYVRYGAFVKMTTTDADGREVPAVRTPTGELVPDDRRPGFHLLDGVAVPPCLQESYAAQRASTMSDFPYSVSQALHFSNSGGVYVAQDKATGAKVLLKEARPHAGLDSVGDAVTRLRSEHWAMCALTGLDVVPKVYGMELGHENEYLAREFVEGTSLAVLAAGRNPLLTGHGNPAALADYAGWVTGVMEKVSDAVYAMHDRGVVFGDLHPNNILVGEDGALHFIDFEAATSVESQSPPRMGAPGFQAPVHYLGAAADRFGLGCIRLWLLLPLTIGIHWGPDQADRLIAAATELYPLDDSFADVVRAELDLDNLADDGRPETSPGGPDREVLVTALLDSAELDRADRLYPGDITQFRGAHGGLDLATGALGVALALTAIGQHVPEAHLDWMRRRFDALAPAGCGSGLLEGWAGMALAWAEQGDDERTQVALDRARAAVVDDLDVSLSSGVAGYGLALLELLDSRPELSAWLDDAVDRCLAAPPGCGAQPGLWHGDTGVALFLLRAHQRTGASELLDRAIELALGEFRSLPGGAGPAGLASGVTGLYAVLHLLSEERHDEELETATQALSAYALDSLAGSGGLADGQAGVLVAAAVSDPAEQVARLASRVDWHLISGAHTGVLGSGSLRLSGDLTTGLAGVLWARAAAESGTAPRLPLLLGSPSA
ncbi:class III lanthionine synthetase LanKC [Luteipulveratus mongoliensis]|uniref:Protein kinase domain-containing protein n=1 Tax=Luteipulveratus mongoliensis TaxID=571913 RepID=A0A0K1JE27_9MICO|nr:class III lanthionine synthetase LanKC [Luteipulveratus mongoliensis]AKU14959.1 hypothetical protein VV02_02220 [Luteipulveratus mongoliensis]